MTAPYWLNIHDPIDFPDVSLALTDPDGLLAIGGDLSVKRLLTAYRKGIFPWYNEDQPILWWSPNPRAVLFPDNLKVSKSLRKTLRKKQFTVSFDKDFEGVIQACAEPRATQSGTWISNEMQQAYIRMHKEAHAHSVECWLDGELVGGLYGISTGNIFFGESMFSRTTDASKVAFVYLVRHLQNKHYRLIDCQVSSDHLETLGASDIDREEFVNYLEDSPDESNWTGHWSVNPDIEKLLLG